MNKIRKLRSRNYDKVVEVQVPVRFYWDKDGYDGFEFGTLEGCTRYQLRLLDDVVNQLFWEHHAGLFVNYIREHYPTQWRQLIEAFDSEIETARIPQTFLDAFKDKGD